VGRQKKYLTQGEAKAAQAAQIKKWHMARPEYCRQWKEGHPGYHKDRYERLMSGDPFRYWKGIWRGVATAIRRPDRIKRIKLSAAAAIAKRRARMPAQKGNSRRGLAVTMREIMAEQDGVCAYCHGRFGERLEVDHKIPRSRGGTNDRENLHLVCRQCNVAKGTMTHEEFLS
jgi:5-methylcytosine-specific restriction endonuclease McrA